MILHLTDRLSDRGGAHRHLLGVLDGLSARGHVLHVAAGVAEVSSSSPMEIVPGLAGRLDQTDGDTAGTIRALEALFSRLEPDVLHVHTVMRPSVLEWAADRGAVITVQDHRVFCPGQGKWTASGHPCELPMGPLTCAQCFADERYFRETLELTQARLAAVRRMRRIVVLSEYMARELVSVGVPRDRVSVIPPFVHGLDLEAPRESGDAHVLFVGRLVAAKGVWDAVAAWRLADLGLPLVFAGTGPLRTPLEAAGFDVRGWLGREDLSALLRRAALVVLPSRWQEPFGIAGLEALAFGIPVVAWDSGGVREWLSGPGLVPWGDVAALAEAMRTAVGTRAASRSGFDENELMDRLVATYRALLR